MKTGKCKSSIKLPITADVAEVHYLTEYEDLTSYIMYIDLNIWNKFTLKLEKCINICLNWYSSNYPMQSTISESITCVHIKSTYIHTSKVFLCKS